MPESGTYGSVPGAPSNGRPYGDPRPGADIHERRPRSTHFFHSQHAAPDVTVCRHTSTTDVREAVRQAHAQWQRGFEDRIEISGSHE
jgi:hypothetical protein